MNSLREWARQLKRDVAALWIAARDRRTPLMAKALAAAVAAYALSPIDLIPDFVPVLGLLDDLLIVPAGIWIVLKMIPQALMIEFRAAADARAALPPSRGGLIAVVLLWLLLAAAGYALVRRWT